MSTTIISLQKMNLKDSVARLHQHPSSIDTEHMTCQDFLFQNHEHFLCYYSNHDYSDAAANDNHNVLTNHLLRAEIASQDTLVVSAFHNSTAVTATNCETAPSTTLEHEAILSTATSKRFYQSSISLYKENHTLDTLRLDDFKQHSRALA